MCLAGPAAGQEFTLSGDEVTIGRAADAVISVPDTSVSRKHALLRKTEDGWYISDLGSGNGTQVNGDSISEEQKLSSSDVIVLGDSEFEFIEAGVSRGATSASPPVRRPPVRTARTGGTNSSVSRPRPGRGTGVAEDPRVAAKKRRRFLMIAGTVLVVLLSVGIGVKAIQNSKEQARAAKRKVLDEQRATLQTEFQRGKNLVKDGAFKEALTVFEPVLAFDAENPTLKPEDRHSLEQYVSRCKTEIPNEELLAEAEQAMAADALGKAAQALGKVKTSIPKLEARLSTLEDALKGKLADKVSDARKKLSASPKDLAVMEQVKTMAEDVLQARAEDRDAPDLKKQAEDNIQRIKNPNLPPPIPETPHLEVMQRFRNGDFSGAVSLAKDCAPKSGSCRSLESQLRDFDSKLKNLESLGPQELRSLYALDKKIAGGQSSDLAKPIRTKLATAFYMEASKSKTVRDWVRAIEHARVVLEVDPSHPGATEIIQKAREQAHEIYLRGYQLRDTNPEEAARLFKDVMMMTPPDDPDHIKSRTRLQELQQQ
jgi:tetratricopeptide (TPR) repeat protein